MGITISNCTSKPPTYHEPFTPLRFGVAAIKGLRQDMEDRHIIQETISGLPDHSLVCVFDGHGGKKTAEFIANQLLKILFKIPQFRKYQASKRLKRLVKALKKTFIIIDQQLREESKKGTFDDSGATAVCAVITPTHIIVANCGDSRCVFGSGGKAIPLSQDHKPTVFSEKVRIEAAGGFVMHGRLNGDLAVSRALGDFGYKDNPELKPENQLVSCIPDVIVHPRNFDADEVLLVACDGVWDVMTAPNAVEQFKRLIVAEGESNISLVCEEILNQCLSSGSMDNMTLVAVVFDQLQPGNGDGILKKRNERDERLNELNLEDDENENELNDEEEKREIPQKQKEPYENIDPNIKYDENETNSNELEII